MLLEQFVVHLRQPLPRHFPLERTLIEYLFPDARFAIGWFDPLLEYDSAPFEALNLQCLEGDRGYYSDRAIRDQLHLNTGADFLAANYLFRSCRTPVQEHTLQLKVVEDGTVISQSGHSAFVGSAHGKISASFAQSLTGLTSTAVQVGVTIKPQGAQSEYRFAIATVASDFDVAPDDLILPRSCFRGEALAVGDYSLTIGIGIFEFATLQKFSLGTTVLVNYPHTVETEFLPRLRAQAEELVQLQSDPRRLAQQYLRRINVPHLPSLTPEESDWFAQLLQTDVDYHLQLLEHPYIAARLIEFGQSSWSAIATGETIKAQSAIAQPDLTLQPNHVSVSSLPDGVELIVLKLPFLTSNDAWVMRNQHLPDRVENCIYFHPDMAAEIQIDFGGDRLAFLAAIDYPTFAAEVIDLQYPHNRYATFTQDETVHHFEQVVSSYQPAQIEILHQHIQRAIALLTEMQRLTPEQRFPYLQAAFHYFQRINWDSFPLDQLDQVIAILQIQVQWLCSEFGSLDPSKPTVLQPFFNQLKQILKGIIAYLAFAVRLADKEQITILNPTQIEVCGLLSRYRSVAWLEDLPADVYATRPMPTANLSAIDTLIQQTNYIWATAPPLQLRPLVQFSQLFPSVALGDSALVKHFANYEQIARALSHLRAASLTTPAISAYQAELKSTVEVLSEFWADSESSILAAQLWYWFHTRNRSDSTLHGEALELAKLVFLRFPQHILNQLKVLQLTRLKVTGLQYFTNKHLGRNWGSQAVPIALSQNKMVNSPDHGKAVILVEGELLGRLTAQSPRLPLGTTAIATIHPLPSSIAVATTTDGIPLRIRTHTAQVLERESLISLEIVSRPSGQNPSKLLWYARVDGETIGILCHRSISVLKTLRRLHSGMVFEVHLHPLLPETAWVELEPSSVRYPQTWQHPTRLN